jgi:hypothetical protein
MADDLTLQRWATALGLGAPAHHDGRFTMSTADPPVAVEFEHRDVGAWELRVRLRVPHSDIERAWAVPDPDPVTVGTRSEPADVFGREVRQIASMFPLVDGRVTGDADAVTVQFVTSVFEEGLNHQSFALTLWSLLHTVEEFELVHSLRARQHAALDGLRSALPSDTFDTAPAPRHAAERPTSWTPSHEVTRRSRTRAQPDPDSPTTATLERRIPVQLLERRGEWAHVLCSNGWTAWIDARDLTPR